MFHRNVMSSILKNTVQCFSMDMWITRLVLSDEIGIISTGLLFQGSFNNSVRVLTMCFF